MTRRRLWPAEVRAAYLATGLVPGRAGMFGDGLLACPMGAICAAAGLPPAITGDFRRTNLVEERFNRIDGRQRPTDYVLWFMLGFDDAIGRHGPLGSGARPKRGRETTAYQDGRAAWEAVKDLAGVQDGD